MLTTKLLTSSFFQLRSSFNPKSLYSILMKTAIMSQLRANIVETKINLKDTVSGSVFQVFYLSSRYS